MINEDIEKVINILESRIFHHECINNSEDFSNSAFVLLELNLIKSELLKIQEQEILKCAKYFNKAA